MAIEPERTICQIIGALTSKELLSIAQLDQNRHILPLLLQIDFTHFETVLTNKLLSWKTILTEVSNYLEDFEIYEGLSFNEEENLESPSKGFLIWVSCQILSIHWLSSGLIDEQLEQFEPAQIQILNDELGELKGVLSAEMAREFFKVRKISHNNKVQNQDEVLRMVRPHENLAIKDKQFNEMSNLMSSQKRDNEKLNNRMSKLLTEIESKNEEISALQNISEQIENEKTTLKSELNSTKENLKKANEVNKISKQEIVNTQLKNDKLQEESQKFQTRFKLMEKDLSEFKDKESEYMAREGVVTEYKQMRTDRVMFMKDIETKKDELQKMRFDYEECLGVLAHLRTNLGEKIAELNATSSRLIELQGENLEYSHLINELEQNVRVLRNETKMQMLNSQVGPGVVIDKRPTGLAMDQAMKLQKKNEELHRLCENSKVLLGQNEKEHRTEIKELNGEYQGRFERLKTECEMRESELIGQIRTKHKEVEEMKDFLRTSFEKMNEDVEKLKQPRVRLVLEECDVLVFRRVSKKDQETNYRNYLGKSEEGIQVGEELRDLLDNDSKNLIYGCVMSFAMAHMEGFKDLELKKADARKRLKGTYGL